MHKKSLLFGLILLVALGLTACGDSTTTLPTALAPTSAASPATTIKATPLQTLTTLPLANPTTGVGSPSSGLATTITVAGGGSSAKPINTKPITYADSNWTVFNSDIVDTTADKKTLALTLKQRAGWAANNQAALVFKLVTGNFKATATVRARKTSDPAQPPALRPSLGGIMARNPAGVDQGQPENYVHIVIGASPNGLGVETKTTLNNDTKYDAPTWDSGDAQLRLCRVGNTFSLYKRHIDDPVWVLATSYNRPDLPQTLQVGANIYSFQGPDLQVSFDNLTIEPLSGQAGCE